MLDLRLQWDTDKSPDMEKFRAIEKYLFEEANRIRYMELSYGSFKIGREVKSGVVYIQRWWRAGTWRQQKVKSSAEANADGQGAGAAPAGGGA